ncbi:protein FAR1-RELATED SEQUENCE 5-like [Henckelia pumila]|uniref:protein FAR1-RELATED SEQUENCE 5-like n=1 Tax=Henckelia pumila TaxID=405737 RepID=UPI003C6E11A9
MNPVIFRDHYQSIRNVIVNSTTSDEFENSWEEVMNCANLVQNDWLNLMYEIRHKWVPAYFKHVFSARMSSSQRSKSSHAFFKKYISNKNSLLDFIIRFNKAVQHQRHNELVADHIDMNERPKTKSNWPMEAQMVNVYTKTKWLVFQNEIGQSHGYIAQQASLGHDFGVYNVINSQGSSSSKTRFEGIPCRHMLAFFRINQVLPMVEQDVIDDPERCLMSRHLMLSCKSSTLIDVSSLTKERTNFLSEQFDFIESKMKEMNIEALSSGSQSKHNIDRLIGINDPAEIRTKGCGKRLKSSKEKSTSKGRLCHGCGRRGVSPDKRNYSNLQSGQMSQKLSKSGDFLMEFDQVDIKCNWLPYAVLLQTLAHAI